MWCSVSVPCGMQIISSRRLQNLSEAEQDWYYQQQLSVGRRLSLCACYRSIFKRTRKQSTRALGQSERNVPPAPIRTPERSSCLARWPNAIYDTPKNTHITQHPAHGYALSNAFEPRLLWVKTAAQAKNGCVYADFRLFV